MQTYLFWIQIAAIGLSVVLTTFMLARFAIVKSRHILIWAVAWFVVAVRVAVGLFLPLQSTGLFLNDFLTVVHDLFWLLGVIVLLELTPWMSYLPLLFLLIYVPLSAIFYFGVNNKVLGTGLTTIIAHPFLLFLLSWYFYQGGKVLRSLGAKIIAGAFALWALDYIALGVLWYAQRIPLAGTIGWTVGFLFRLALFLGFILMVTEQKKGQ
ncbi:MAG: hypothetical protein AB1393_02750 [Candidatus Edwardsbacteria bacterium]